MLIIKLLVVCSYCRSVQSLHRPRESIDSLIMRRGREGEEGKEGGREGREEGREGGRERESTVKTCNSTGYQLLFVHCDSCLSISLFISHPT